MRKFFDWLDKIAETNRENRFALWLERASFVFLILMVLSAPHSIAATQTAWLLGMFLWVVRLFVKPRPRLVRTPLDAALWAFFGWSVITSIFSYAPDISFDRLRNVSLFLIFYYVINLVRNKSAARFIIFALVFSTMVNVVWMPVERIIGRGFEIHGVAAESPLAKATLKDGDAVLEANGGKIRTPEQLISQIEQSETTKVKFYRPDAYYVVDVQRANLLGGTSASDKLGFREWERGRRWRAAGFYGHYTTYADVLQLIGSLVFGLFIAGIGRRKESGWGSKLPFSFSPLLLFSVAAIALALVLTVTRGPQLAFLISAFTIVLLNGNRKIILALTALALPLVVGGLIYVQQNRQAELGESNNYRQVVWREGFDLWTQNTRHFTLGVGMDSMERYRKEWRLYDNGRLPPSHFHSTPLQLVVERGLPALLLWLWILWAYGRTLWRGIKIPDSGFQISDAETGNSELQVANRKFDKGVLLGCFGSMVGFFVSGIVHYNLGDAEVAMVFFLLMGLSVVIAEKSK